MTREEAIKQLEKHTQYKLNGKDLVALDIAIEALEQTRWIPVSERLPDIGQRVLVTYNQEDKLKVDTTFFDRHGFLIGIVTAWMPLPQPYMAESEDKE